MLRNYLLVSIRNLLRNSSYSFINLIGLAIGFASAIVIGMWVIGEYSYEKSFLNAERIHKVGINFMNMGDMAIAPMTLADHLKKYEPVENAANLTIAGDLPVSLNGLFQTKARTFHADEHFFNIFNYEVVEGGIDLKQPAEAIISNKLATTLFGEQSAINQVIEIGEDKVAYNIVGVVNTNFRSHISGDIWLAQKEKSIEVNWYSAGTYCYVMMKENGVKGERQLDEILLDIRKNEVHPKVAADEPLDEWLNSGIYNLIPMPISDIYLKSTLKFEAPGGNERNTQIFAGIALLILVLACINFINISTARATVRAKEIGIRKSLGTNRMQLIAQFTIESLLLSVLALFLGIILGEFFLGIFEYYTDIRLLNTLLSGSIELLFLALFSILIGIIAGLFPAVYLSKFQAANALKGNLELSEKGFFRSALVLFQFIISISLLAVSVFIIQQIQYMQNTDLGLDRENVIVIRNLDEISENKIFFKQELLKFPQVNTASINQRVPATSDTWVQSIYKDTEEEIWAHQFSGDYDMVPSFGYRVVRGRNFSKDLATDTSALLINETMAKMLDYDDPIGKTLNDGKYRIIGIVSDFNYESLKSKIGPVILALNENDGKNIGINITAANPQPVLDKIEDLWKSLNPEEAMDYYFLDDNYSKLLIKEKILSKAIILFTVLAMIISCLGLFGLSSFIAERKTKEIGIRRVLGASVLNITYLLSKKFTKPIVIAFILAVPIVYFSVNRWLENFAYRVEINYFFLLLCGASALLIGLITVSWQSVRTALKDPVISLRNE